MKDSSDNDRKSCFIIMPFDDEYRKVYDNCIQPLVEKKLGMECVRIDEWPSAKMTINENIKAQIKKCRFAIADLSLDKPNVYYEIGLAHAIGKEVVFIKNKQLDNLEIPFDISPWHVFVYDKDVINYETLFKKIIKMIQNDFPDINIREGSNNIVGGWRGVYQVEKEGRAIFHEVELTIVGKGRAFEAFSKIEIDNDVKLIQLLKYNHRLNGEEWKNGNWIEFIGTMWGNKTENINDYWLDVYAINKDTDGETLQVKIWDNVNTKKIDVIFERIS
ncbi:MAG: hypothetical protein J6Y55_04180 [Bacteroidales bacterium]|nr:hypothetical protein [Bacteroidales bacterium]